jgi:WD40 repeat protein
LAQLEDVQGEVYILTDEGKIEAEPGQKLFAGQGVSTSGERSSVVVQYADATRLELAGDTQVHFVTGARGNKIEVAQGTGDISGMTDGNRMTLSTPHVDVQAQGGKFSFTSLPDGGTRVESEKGQVKVTRKSDGKSVTVESGQYAVANRRPDPMKAIAVPNARLTLDEGSPVQSLAFTSDSQTLLNGGSKGHVHRWNLATGQQEEAHEKPSKRVNALCLSADGMTLAMAGDDRTVFIWNLATGKERQVGSTLRTKVFALAFSPDGRWLVAGCEDHMVRFLDLVTGEEQVVLKGHKGKIDALAYSSDGRFIASVGGSEKQPGEVLLWDASRQQLISALDGHDGEVLAVAFAPDSKLLATGGRDNTLRFWNPGTGKTIHILRGHAGAVSALAFAPDGKTLASGACDGLVKLWDVAGGVERVSFKGHKSCVGALSFSPDGKTLASGGRDKTIKVWDRAQLEIAPPTQVSLLGTCESSTDGSVSTCRDFGQVKQLHQRVFFVFE